MAIVVESISVQELTFINPVGDCALTKPSGTVSGDFLIANIFSATNNHIITPASGFTLIRSANNAGGYIDTYYKLAGGGEPSSYTFTTDHSGGGHIGGLMMRISGSAGVIQTSTSATANNTTTPTFANTVTPTYANSLLVFPIYQPSSSISNPAQGGFAITTSNPSWTSHHVSNSGGVNAGFNVGSAVRPEITATGDSSATFGGDATADGLAQMIVLEPIQNASISPSIITIAATVQVPAVAQGQVVTPSIVTIAATVQVPVVGKSSTVSDTSKNNGTFTNTQKS